MAKYFANVNVKTWAIIGVVIFAIIIFNYYTQKKEGFESDNKIPNIIWTFWDGDLPPLVKACIESWKRHNPEYKIIVLNKQNVQEYLPEPDLSKMRHVNDFVQRYSDFVRIHILAKHGGIWLDSSVICQKPLSWIHDIQHETGAEYIGYFTDSMTSPEYREKSPVIENWAFACTPDCQFTKDWRDQMASFTKYEKFWTTPMKLFVQEQIRKEFPEGRITLNILPCTWQHKGYYKITAKNIICIYYARKIQLFHIW